MYLRNFEKTFPGGDPIAGATITIYTAILTGAHGAPLTFTDHNGVSSNSTTTNADGMWAATDLPDGAYYDIKIEYNTKIRWLMGRSMHQVEHLYDDKTPAANRNLLKNGGQDDWARWLRNGSVTISGISTADVEIADYWVAAVTGGGDSATGTRAVAAGIASQYVSELVYTRVAGNLKYRYIFPVAHAKGLQGKAIGAVLAIYQTANARVKPYITDSAGTTFGTVLTTVGAWAVISVNRTVDPASTSLEIGWITDTPVAGGYTIRTCMALADYGAQVPVFTVYPYSGKTPGESDRFVGTLTIDDTQVLTGNLGYLSEIANSYARRIKEIIGAAGGNWRSVIPSSLTALLALVTTAQTTANTGVTNAATAQAAANAAQTSANAAQASANSADANANTRVVRTGDAMTGALTVTDSGAGTVALITRNSTAGSTAYGLGVLNALANGWDLLIDHVTAAFGVAISGTSAAFSGAITAASATLSGAITAASGTINGTLTAQQGGVFHDWSAVTFSATSDVSIAGTSVKARSSHTGTQAPATISPQGSGSGLDADTLRANTPANLVARANHTGTQAPSTISPQGSGSGLGADTLDGLDATAFSLSGHTHTAAPASAGGAYVGNSAGARVIANSLGYQPRLVVISGPISMGMIHRDTVTSVITYGGTPSFVGGGSLDASGFTVPAAFNLTGTYTWVAFP